MSADLARTLREQLQPGTPASPALQALLDDYTRYHVVLVVVGAAFLVATAALTVACGRRFAAASRTGRRGWSLERWAYAGVAAASVLVAAFLAVVVAANVSTVLRPVDGFAGAIGLLGSPRPGSPAAVLQDAFDGWLRSGGSSVPALVQASIDERLSWQRPKAIVCAVLLVGFVALAALVLRALVRRSRGISPRRAVSTAGLVLAGGSTVAACVLLMLMVMGNTQGSIAPLSLTLFYG